MERLTHRYTDGEAWASIYKVCACGEHECKGPIIERLAAYEDTSLMPEEVVGLAQAKQDERLVELPFVAMVEQSLRDGIMKPPQDQRFNGRYAVIYVDKKKWASPLIDICGDHYDREQAETRLAELTREEAEAALSKQKEE